MLRIVASRVAWVGRTASMVFGLALVLALLFGVASMAFSATGKPFILGKNNSATETSKLMKNGAGAALSLLVGENQPPLKVNSDAKVANLNADLLDGQDSSAFLPTDGTAADADKVDGQDAEDLKPLLADVEADGTPNTFANTRGVVSVEKLGTGIYEVTFDRAVHNCPRVGGVGAPLNSVYLPDPDFVRLQQFDGQASTFNSTRGGDKIGVITNSPSGGQGFPIGCLLLNRNSASGL